MPFFKLKKKKGPFEWTPEADRAFQDLKKYLTSPPVIVAPRPLEPLVLYLAATPYSASTALVAVREERKDKSVPRQARADAAQGQEGTPGPSATEDQARQGSIAETPEDGQVSGNPPPQDTPQSPQDLSLISVPALAEHPVYLSTPYCGTQGHATPCRKSSYSHFWWLRASCDTTSRGTPSRSSRLTHWRGYSGAQTHPEGSLNGTSSCKHSSWSSAPPGS